MSRAQWQAAPTLALLCAATPAHGSGLTVPPALLGEDPTHPYALPDAPAPPTLPDLTHRALAISFENAFASLKMTTPAGQSGPGRTFAWLERLEIEHALAIRRWYLGVAHEMAAGTDPETGRFAVVSGHPEVWGRAVWASRAGLAYGGGLGLVVPVANRSTLSSAHAVALRVRGVRPWDHLDFASETFTLRPFIDVRDIDGPVILQLRQGIDWARPGTASTELASRTTIYIGYRPTELVGLGLEAWEEYVIRAPLPEDDLLRTPNVRDDARAAYALSPSVRFMTRALQPAISFLFPIDRPLFGELDGYWAFRLSLDVVLDPGPD